MSEPEPITINPMASVFNYIADLERQLNVEQRKVAWFLVGYKGIGEQYKEMKIQLAEAQGERDALMKAGITDYSKLTGTNRVDCHFCNGVWRTEDSAKHKSTCPLGRILSKEGNE